MTDPISLVALGAAVGGAAGRVAEKAWDAAEKWLSRRFGENLEAVRAQARLNSAEFVRQLASRVEELERERPQATQQIRDNQSDPQFSALLQDTVEYAAQTPDPEKHSLLASVVAARLAVPTETTLSLASPLAVTAIARATRRQLRLLGLMCFVDDIRPKTVESSGQFKRWVTTFVTKFEKDEFHRIDAQHLVALACISFNPTSERDLSVALNFKAIHITEDLVEFDDVRGFSRLAHNWTEVLSGVRLTSVGSPIGGHVLGQIFGMPMPDPEWP